MINILTAAKLMQNPRLYTTFLLWMLSELFEQLPELGDPDKPKLVFFFDEAHLLFNDAPKSLMEKIEQVVRLIRSKGVGVYFVTQNSIDVPERVLGQLGNRVQHALRAFTPVDQKSVRVAAETFRPNPAFRTETAITELAVGEALVSLLDAAGVPGVVQRARICPPRGRIGPITPEERAAIMQASPVAGKYDRPIDRESAYERLGNRAASAVPAANTPAAPVREGSPWRSGAAPENPWGEAGQTPAPPSPPQPYQAPAPGGGLLSELLTGGGRRQSIAEAAAKSLVRSLGSQVGTQIGRAVLRGVFGSLTR